MGINASKTKKTAPTLVRYDAQDPKTTPELLISTIEREGGVVVENLITQELAAKIKTDLKPHFDSDQPDKSGFFPLTTQRATGLLGISDACVELATNPIFINIANAMVSSTHTFWRGDHQETVREKPIISSTVGFRVNPGGRQQVLHRDDKYVLQIST
jgi:ectoine hydroxylase-related dioxygenase (phytanoyl-CoA dioxygenase family)